jgi:hypothetical protein
MSDTGSLEHLGFLSAVLIGWLRRLYCWQWLDVLVVSPLIMIFFIFGFNLQD